MFDRVRLFARHTVALILMGLLVASFALWGISGTIFNLAAPYEVASVGKTDVTLNDYLLVYQQNLSRMNRQTGQDLTRDIAQFYGVESSARDQILTSATLDEYARRMNIGLSDERLYTQISENPAYQSSDGTFDASGLARTLAFNGVRESDFKRVELGNAVRNQIMAAIGHGDVLPAAYGDALSSHKHEERKFSYLAVTPELIGPAPEPTDEELQELFESDEDKYDTPEFRKLSILAMRPDDLADSGILDEERIQAVYDEGTGDWVVLEKRRIEQIVLDAETLEETKQSIEDGATFDDLLTTNDLTKSDADLGLLEQTELPQALQEPAFALEQDVMSEIIDGEFGPTILRVVEISAGSTKPFEDVKQQIADDLALREAADNILDYYNELEDTRASGISLEEAAQRIGLEVEIFESIDSRGNDASGERIESFPSERDLLTQAFTAEVGDQTSPIEYEEIGYIWYEVLEITESRDSTFEESKEQLTEDWHVTNDQERVDAKIEEFEERLKAGEEMSVLAEELDAVDEVRFTKEQEEKAAEKAAKEAEEGEDETEVAEQEEPEERVKIEVSETQFLKRDGRDSNFPNGAIKEGFAHSVDKQVFVADGQESPSKIIFQIVDSQMAEPAEAFEDDIESANLTAVNDVLRKFLDKLQDDYGTTFNYELVDQALSGTLAPPGYQAPY